MRRLLEFKVQCIRRMDKHVCVFQQCQNLLSSKVTRHSGFTESNCQVVPTPWITGRGKHSFFYSNLNCYY